MEKFPTEITRAMRQEHMHMRGITVDVCLQEGRVISRVV